MGRTETDTPWALVLACKENCIPHTSHGKD